MRTNADTDYLPAERIPDAVQLVLGGADPSDPRVSVINADLSGLPPLQVFAGGREVLLDSIVAFSEKARAAGTEVELVVEPHMFHDWLTVLPSGVASMLTVERIGEFLRTHVDQELITRTRSARVVDVDVDA